jgi:uncharacterized membrane protein
VKAFFGFCKREPVMCMAVLNAVIVLGAAFGAKLTTEQVAAISGLAAVILGVGGGIVRGAVSPIATMPAAAKASIDKQEKAEEAKADGKP